MTMMQSVNCPQPFSAEQASQYQLVMAMLLHRISRLPRESLQCLTELGPALATCESQTEFDEIAETIREIIFPEVVGGVRCDLEDTVESTERLESWASCMGSKIKQARSLKEMTQAELAEKSGLPQSHISRIESGKHSPSRRTLERLARALGKEVRDFDPTCD